LTQLKEPASTVVACKLVESPFEGAGKKLAGILVARTPADIYTKHLIDIDIDFTWKTTQGPFEAAKKAS
jgi:hypothetical protein